MQESQEYITKRSLCLLPTLGSPWVQRRPSNSTICCNQEVFRGCVIGSRTPGKSWQVHGSQHKSAVGKKKDTTPEVFHIWVVEQSRYSCIVNSSEGRQTVAYQHEVHPRRLLGVYISAVYIRQRLLSSQAISGS